MAGVGQQPAAHGIAQRLVLVGHAEDLDVGARERDDAIVRAPAGVPAARQRGQAVSLPEPVGDRLDVAGADDHMVDAHAGRVVYEPSSVIVVSVVPTGTTSSFPTSGGPEHARHRRRHLRVDLVGLHEADGVIHFDSLALLLEPLDERRIEHRQAPFGQHHGRRAHSVPPLRDIRWR